MLCLLNTMQQPAYCFHDAVMAFCLLMHTAVGVLTMLLCHVAKAFPSHGAVASAPAEEAVWQRAAAAAPPSWRWSAGIAQVRLLLATDGYCFLVPFVRIFRSASNRQELQ